MNITRTSEAREPKDDITDAERKEWYSRLSWEKELDPQKECRLRREGLFWTDPALDALDVNDKKWEVVQMGFQQVGDILESIDMEDYHDYFLSKGFTYGAKLRWMTRKYLDTKMTAITKEEDKEKILDACANVCRDENIRFFATRYGNPDQHLLECPKGRAFLSEKWTHEGWFREQGLLSAAYEKDFREKRFAIPAADYDSIEDWDSWALGIDASGRGMLFPMDDSQVPPCVRNPQLHIMTAIDIAMDWKNLRSVSTGTDSRLVFYDWKNDKPTQELLLPKVVNGTAGDWFAALDASFEVERMAVGASHGHVYLMDMAIFKPVLDLLGHRAFVRRVIADWAQQRVASCSSDGYLNVYDTRSGTAIWELPHDRCCDAMDVSFDAGLALCKPLQKPMKLWDLKTGRTVKEFAIPGHKPSWMKVNWDTQIVCTGADDKVKFWDLETGEVSKTIDCHHHLTQCLDVDWDAGLLLTGSVDAHLKLWDIETQSFMKRFLQGTRCLTRVLFH